MVNFAQYGLIIILAVFLVFHFLVLLKFIPYKIVWGGRLKSDKDMYRFEVVSILINLFFLFVILVYANILTVDMPKKLITIILWIMAVLFALNTLGNIFSKNKTEQRLFTPITIILAFFSLVLALAG